MLKRPLLAHDVLPALAALLAFPGWCRAGGGGGEEAPSRGGRSWLNSPERAVNLHLAAEVGGQQVLANSVRYGVGAPEVALAKDGEQGLLSLYRRFSAELQVCERHRVILTYQPLSSASRQAAPTDLRVGSALFAAGTALDVQYTFDIFRLGYQFDLLADSPHQLALGADLQVRSARVVLSAPDGGTLFSQQDVGAVPLLRVASRYVWPAGWSLSAEVDGLYAPLGRDAAGGLKQGALVDASVRVGMGLARGAEGSVGLRYLFGGFTGEARGIPASLGGPVPGANWLQLLALSVGLRI